MKMYTANSKLAFQNICVYYIFLIFVDYEYHQRTLLIYLFILMDNHEKFHIYSIYYSGQNNLHFQHTFTCRELVYIIIATVELYSTT